MLVATIHGSRGGPPRQRRWDASGILGVRFEMGRAAPIVAVFGLVDVGIVAVDFEGFGQVDSFE